MFSVLKIVNIKIEAKVKSLELEVHSFKVYYQIVHQKTERPDPKAIIKTGNEM